jgi:hypothetical protein
MSCNCLNTTKSATDLPNCKQCTIVYKNFFSTYLEESKDSNEKVNINPKFLPLLQELHRVINLLETPLKSEKQRQLTYHQLVKQKAVHKWKRDCTLQEETKILERFKTIQLKIKEFHVLCELNHNNEIALRKLTYFCKKLEKVKKYYLEDDGGDDGSDFHGPT